MKNKILMFSLVLGAVLLGGCSVNSDKNPGFFSSTAEYDVSIVKSESFINNVKTIATKNCTAQQLLVESEIDYKMSGEELGELDGVIATASNHWNLYIDDSLSDLDSSVNKNSKIEFKYETR